VGVVSAESFAGFAWPKELRTWLEVESWEGDPLKYATICSRQRCLPKWRGRGTAAAKSFDYKLMSCLPGTTQTKCQKMPLIRLRFRGGQQMQQSVLQFDVVSEGNQLVN